MPQPRQHFVILFGPPAVGKMTVAYAIAKQTGFRVFHNHMTIDLVLPFFDFGTPPFGRLVRGFRQRIFEEVAQSSLPGLIFTYVWALNDPGDKAFIDQCCDIFRQHNWEIVFVELEADQAERLKRNTTEFRLTHKPSKRNLAWSQQNLLELDRQHKLNSTDDFIAQTNYLKVVTTRLSAEETAEQIIRSFGLPTVEHGEEPRL